MFSIGIHGIQFLCNSDAKISMELFKIICMNSYGWSNLDFKEIYLMLEDSSLKDTLYII